MPNWDEICGPSRDTALAPSVPEHDDTVVNGVAGVTGTLPYAVGLPGHRTRWLKVELAVDTEETVEAAENVETSLKAGDAVPLRVWSR
jgi:hypothetical protein